MATELPVERTQSEEIREKCGDDLYKGSKIFDPVKEFADLLREFSTPKIDFNPTPTVV